MRINEPQMHQNLGIGTRFIFELEALPRPRKRDERDIVPGYLEELE